MVVAELFAALGLKMDSAAWRRGEKMIQRLGAGLGKVVEWGAKAAKAGAIALASTSAGAVLLGDSYTELENRLRQVAKGQDGLNDLMDRTRAIANATRSDWKATGEAFVRLTNATKDMGLSEERRLKIIETLNMALQSSGASATEAAAGTLQLMQGLASGALQGDEFRSIAEQLPDLMDLFAKEMGVSRGELKKLGSEGKITADVVIRSLENASESVRDKFGKSTATAAQNWAVLKNEMVLAAGEFLKGAGFANGLTDAVKALTEWIESHRTEIQAFGFAVAETFRFVVRVVKAVARGIMVAIDGIVAAWGAVVSAAKRVARAFSSAWEWISAGARAFVDFVIGIPGAIVDAFAAMGRGIVDAVVGAFDFLIEKAKEAASAIWEAIEDTPVIGHAIRGAEWVGGKLGDAADAVFGGPSVVDMLKQYQANAATVASGGTPGQVAQALGGAGAATTNTASSVTNIGSIGPITQLPGESGEQFAARVATIVREQGAMEKRAAFDAVRGGLT